VVLSEHPVRLMQEQVLSRGVGGAERDGAGLLGLDDRVAALGGRLRVHSRPAAGTRIRATLPLTV
jgi:signal transduction histidine kinase